jgi:hypothetical protein
VLDRVKPRGGDTTPREQSDSTGSKASIDAFASGKSAAETAAKIGTSTKQVERVRAVLASGDEATPQRGPADGGDCDVGLKFDQTERSVWSERGLSFWR